MFNNDWEIGAEQINQFEEAGVVKIEGIFAPETMRELAGEIDKELVTNIDKAFAYTKSESSRFIGSQDIWRTNSLCQKICAESVLPGIVGKLTRSAFINLFFDHVFVKEPNANIPTNLHNDGGYWPITGSKIASAWVSVDSARSGSGAMAFVIGSHRWASSYQPISFALKKESSTIEEMLTLFARKTGADERNLSFEIIETEPGDALVFNSRTLHAAYGNGGGTSRRRGYAVRYTGDDVRYDPTRVSVHKMMLEPSLSGGDLLTCARFPLVWRREK